MNLDAVALLVTYPEMLSLAMLNENNDLFHNVLILEQPITLWKFARYISHKYGQLLDKFRMFGEAFLEIL